MEARRYIPRYTVADYRNWKGDWELWDGIAVAMSPSPSFIHGTAVTRLIRLLSDQLESDGCGHCSVVTEIDWVIREDTVVRPDISVVCGPPPAMHIDRPPTLIVEVLSPATRLRDRNEKRELYREHGVRHYFVADPDTGAIQSLTGDSHDADADLNVDLGDGCRVRLPEHLPPARTPA